MPNKKGPGFETVIHLESKLFWMGLELQASVEEKPDILAPDNLKLKDLLDKTYDGWDNHWFGIIIPIVSFQNKLATTLANHEEFLKNYKQKGNGIFNINEKYIRNEYADITAIQRSRKDTKLKSAHEQGIATLMGFGPTLEFQRVNAEIDEPRLLWKRWFETDEWRCWREGTWPEFAIHYWNAVCEDRLYFPEYLQLPKVDLRKKSNPLPELRYDTAKGILRLGAEAPEETLDKANAQEPSAPESDQIEPAPERAGRHGKLIAAAIGLTIASFLLATFLFLRGPPAKATGDCVPGLGNVNIRLGDLASDDPVTAECSAEGEFRFPASIAGRLDKVAVSQMMPTGLADETRPLPLGLLPLNADDPFGAASTWRAADFGPPLSPAGMIYSSRVVDLGLTCPSGSNQVRIVQENEQPITRDCTDVSAGASRKLILPVYYDGLSRQPLKVTYLQNGEPVLACNLTLGLPTEAPIDVRSTTDCKPAPDMSPPDNVVTARLIPLRSFYPDTDVYVADESGIGFLRDLNRYGNYRFWNAGGTNNPLSGLLQQVRSDTEDDRWRFASANEVNALLSSLLRRDPEGETIARLFKGRLTSTGRYILAGLAKDENCQETGFRRIGLQGRWPLQTNALENYLPVNPCAVTDKDMGFWLVKN
ncbi:hypothetical protein WNZ14_20475 [Hoeflea sp. AS60]|uniref:hypothetical protein n=1 Tax=Hoeflea sp. AS60 TaxID=3135780 RepID=UPI00316F9C43